MHSAFPQLRFLLLLSLSLILSLGYSQSGKTNFTGKIVDDADLPIPGATLMIVQATDSTLVQFGTTNTEGTFTIKGVPKGEYLLNVNFLGMAPLFLPITAGVEEEKNMGTIKMQAASKVLGAVEITADHMPIEITKDTISYNADAFETQPNAVVEDLLKKLPGIEVGSDGTITAQGEQVNKVLVDGKEFFGDDPKMATKNLPARALKKVKVYDKQSEVSEFTGVDDGVRERTIDLQLKEEFKKGLFGTAQAGYGTDEKYNARASINKFSKTSQLSFLGQFNNINDQGFSFSDRMNFSGGSRGGMGGGGMRTVEMRVSSSDIPFGDAGNAGLVTTGAAGLNFNYQKNKNFNIRSSYFYNNVDKDLLKDAFRQNRAVSDPYDTYEDSEDYTANRSHSFALNSDWQVDSTSQVQISSRLNFGNGDATGESFLENYVSTLLENRTVNTTADASDNLSFSGGLTYMKRLGTRGRNFSLSGNYSKNETDTESALEAINEFFTTGNTELLNQLQASDSEECRYDGQFSYTEPLGKRRFLEFGYSYNNAESNYKKAGADILPDGSTVLNPELTTDYTSVFQYHRPGMTFRYSGEVHNINIGLQYQLSDLDGHIDLGENAIGRSYSHLLPRAIWRYDIGNGKNLRVSYTTRVNSPSITQLSPVVNNSDPLRLYVGNPELDAEYNHNLNINLHSFSQFSSSSFFASLSGTLTKDKIITSRTVDAMFIETSKPINIDDESRMSVYASYGRPFKPLHSRFSVNANLSYTKTQNFIQTDLLDTDRWSRSGGLTISNMNSKVLEYNLGGRWTFTDNLYKSNEALNQKTLLSNYFIDATVTIWKKWKLQGGYDYNLYSSDEFAENQSLPLMKVSLSRFVLPNDKGQIKLSVFDVLDENRGLSRSADVNYLEEVRTNSIGRYAMLSFIYTIGSNMMGGPPGGGMIIQHRG
jgi:hypothetical protein